MEKYRHPWNFGMTPSQYIESTEDKRPYIEEALYQLGAGTYTHGLERLDDLFLHTLECPEMRILEPGLRRAVERTGTKDAALVASHARPGCCFYSLNMERAKSFFSDPETISKLGIFYLNELDPPSSEEDPAIDNVGMLNMSFSPRINDECVRITGDCNSGRVSKSAYDMIMGISFGFPVGDVIEVAAGSPSLLLDESVVSHFITPAAWTKLWMEKVGMRDEAELAEIYKNVLGKGNQQKS